MKDKLYLAWSAGKAPAESIGGGVVTALLRFALESGRADAVLTVKQNADRFDGVPAVVTDPAQLEATAGNLHCATPNIVRCLKQYLDGAFTRKIAVVCKPCDARGIIELAKRHQVNPDNILLIGLNCTGVLAPLTAKRMYREEFDLDPAAVRDERIFPPGNKYFADLHDGTTITKDLYELETKGFGRRDNCRCCEVNIPRMADLAIGKWGTHGKPVSFVEACTDKGAAFFNAAVEAGLVKREKPSADIIAEREKFDKASIKVAKEWQERIYGPYRAMTTAARREYWFSQFDRCIKCYGCRDACPICFCKECVLEADRGVVPKGIVPPENVFGLTRAMHVADSCVNCGQCQDVCPVEIPLATLIGMLNQDIKGIFGYEPGMDLESKPPLTMIESDEAHLPKETLQFG